MMNKFSKRLFSLPLIDFIFIIIIVGVFISALVFFTRTKETIFVDLVPYPQEWLDEALPPMYTIADSINIGDMSYNALGQKAVEITNIDRTEAKGIRKTMLITARLQVVYDSRTHQYVFNDTPVLIGNKLTINTQKTVFNGQIINVYHSKDDQFQNYEKKEAIVVIKIRKLEQWTADSLRNFESKNSQGDVVAHTTDIYMSPSELDVDTDKGVVYKGYSTIYTDVILTLKLKNVYCSGTTCYFNHYQPLRIGQLFTIQSSSALIDKGDIIDFKIL